MDNERVSHITIDGVEYPLLLSTRAVKQISERYGGLKELGEKLASIEKADIGLGEVIWLICLLANQQIMKDQIKDPANVREPLREEYVELMTTPLELADFNNAILEAFMKGTVRNIESAPEVEEKNAKRV
jgi:hypothetical protein